LAIEGDAVALSGMLVGASTVPEDGLVSITFGGRSWLMMTVTLVVLAERVC
jgi:hypothetical protein